MSKPVKELLRKEFARRFADVSSLAVVDQTGVDAVRTNQIRARLRDQGIRLTVVKNAMARQVLREQGMDAAVEVVEGPCALAYGEDGETAGIVSVVRELLEIGKETPALTVKAAVMEGQVYRGDDQVEALSKLPTRDEALAKLVACVLGPAGRLVGAVSGPSRRVAGLVKAVQQRHEESAEAA
ncbi:MAG: 50S ribosomal protein L10 [Phycisphaerae bacterium]|nr:50S ribosomal protein L10 [Phycisphaerae bacterium]